MRLVVDLVAVLAASVAVADGVGLQTRGGINGCGEVRKAVGSRLNQQDVAVGTDCAHHINIKRDFLRPATVPSWIAGSAVLIDLPKTAIGCGTRGKTKLRTIDRQVGLGIRVIVGVHDSHSLPTSCCGRGEFVGGLKIGGIVSRRRARGAAIAHQNGVTASEASRRPGTYVRLRGGGMDAVGKATGRGEQKNNEE